MAHNTYVVPLRSTRYSTLFYAYIDVGLWRFVVCDNGCCHAVGPYYRTRVELLADVDRYAGVYGLA